MRYLHPRVDSPVETNEVKDSTSEPIVYDREAPALTAVKTMMKTLEKHFDDEVERFEMACSLVKNCHPLEEVRQSIDLHLDALKQHFNLGSSSNKSLVQVRSENLQKSHDDLRDQNFTYQAEIESLTQRIYDLEKKIQVNLEIMVKLQANVDETNDREQ